MSGRCGQTLSLPLPRHTALPVILMHNRSNPASVVRAQLGNAYVGSTYENLMEDVKRELLASVELALRAGIEEFANHSRSGLWLWQDAEHNLTLINRLDEIASGVSVLLGPSRNRSLALHLTCPPTSAVEGTAATVAVGITRGGYHPLCTMSKRWRGLQK